MVFFGGQAKKAENGLRAIIFAEARAKRQAENAKRQAHNNSLLAGFKLAPTSVPTVLADAFLEICEVKGPKQHIFSTVTRWVENHFESLKKDEQAAAPNELAKKTLAVLNLAVKCKSGLNESEDRSDFYRDVEPFLADLPVHNNNSWVTSAAIDNLFMYGIRGLASTMLEAQIGGLFKAADHMAKTTEAFNQQPQSTEASEKLGKAMKQFKAQAKSVRLTISQAYRLQPFCGEVVH